MASTHLVETGSSNVSMMENGVGEDTGFSSSENQPLLLQKYEQKHEGLWFIIIFFLVYVYCLKARKVWQ